MPVKVLLKLMDKIDKINLKTLRKSISIAPQEALLFSDTILKQYRLWYEKKPRNKRLKTLQKSRHS